MDDKCSWINDTLIAVICRCANDEVARALGSLPGSIQNLTFLLYTSRQFLVPPLELFNISNLTQLQHLTFRKDQPRGMNHLMFEPETFQNLTELKELHINIVTSDSDIGNMIKFAAHLKVLDLAYTHNLNKVKLKSILQSFKQSSLNTLILRSFQVPGSQGFSDSLSISKLFGQPLGLTNLDISGNTLGGDLPKYNYHIPKPDFPGYITEPSFISL